MLHTPLLQLTGLDIIGLYFLIQIIGVVASLVLGLVVATLKALFF